MLSCNDGFLVYHLDSPMAPTAPRVGLLLAFLVGTAAAPAAAGSGWERFRPKGLHNNAIHRYFPDLDARQNAVRYGRWRALEIAWVSGIDSRLDTRFSSYLLALLADPPRFPPEPERVAPRFVREARPLFRALYWGQMLEQQLGDALAAIDATAQRTRERLENALAAYGSDRHALAEPSEAPPMLEVLRAAPVSARILLSGTRLFVRAAEDLARSDFGQQRWRVRDTIGEFDRSFATEQLFEEATYRVSAPTVGAVYPAVTESLDRLTRFRAEVFQALIPGGQSAESRRERDERARAVARRYGLPAEGIGAE
jgi:hypothetical protein